MASKFLFYHMLLALAFLSASRASPVIHIISAVRGINAPPINIEIKAGGNIKGPAQLSPGQDYQLNIDLNDVYYATAVFGLKFTSFRAYEPVRDMSRAAVYWRADNDGFAISYDKINWTSVAPWESE